MVQALISHPGYLTFSDQEKSQRLERNPVSRFEEYITAHHHETSEDRAHEEFIFGQLINNLLKLESFTGQIDMIRNWKMNQKEAVSLYVNSKELSVLSFALENLVRQNRGSTESLLAMKLLKKSQRNFSALIHLRLMNLGDFNPKNSNTQLRDLLLSYHADCHIAKYIQGSNPDIFTLIPSQAYQKFGQICLEEVKTFIINQKIRKYFVRVEKVTLFKGMIVWKYVLKMIDFLLVNKFINQDVVRGIFQDEEMVKQVHIYTSACFHHEIKESIIGSPSGFTTHWYWKSLNKLFTLLGKGEEVIIDLSFLLWNIGHISSEFLKLDQNYQNRVTRKAGLPPLPTSRIQSVLPPMQLTLLSQSDEWKIFKSCFLEKNEYIRKIGSGKQSGYTAHLEGHKMLKELQSSDLGSFEDDCEKIMNLLLILMGENFEYYQAKNSHLRDFTFLICGLLDFIQREFTPGIIKNQIKEKPEKFENFEDQFNLLLFYSRIKDSKIILNNYVKFIKDGNLPLQDHPYGSIHEKYYKMIVEDFDKFNKIYVRVEKRANLFFKWLKGHVTTDDHVHGDQKRLEDM
ncbi:hypothetical protein Pst134EA_002651 [Puccinia striiformis f. sp. tritici]|uniref:hypothetical protein n=1 Tax=Puccinia striiformis f. sp. tritici TaxID=168172 RepID=UPI002007E456|nr:hypothetical protein Pst134EA_002651 [Puccinia striiformis f. sp. tritici]KAH9472023.1 hypothetical protein Pst134EA_002651 [Puccinia striiformis f. sp. tritici]